MAMRFIGERRMRWPMVTTALVPTAFVDDHRTYLMIRAASVGYLWHRSLPVASNRTGRIADGVFDSELPPAPDGFVWSCHAPTP